MPAPPADWSVRDRHPFVTFGPDLACSGAVDNGTGPMNHDLNITALAVVSACVIIWGLVSARLERWDVSAPMAFVVLGVVVTHGPTSIVHFTLHSSTIRGLAEVTLALVLFADASRVNVRALRADAVLPARLLGIGLPLTIGAGAATAALLFGGSGLWVAAAIGAIVAPTDAALGASIMTDERVPSGVRRLINVESGLNDGIATPFVNLFIAGAVTTEAVSGTHVSDGSRSSWWAGPGSGSRSVSSAPCSWPWPAGTGGARRASGRSPSSPWRCSPTRARSWRGRTASSPPSWPAWPSAPWTITTTRPRLRFTEEAGTLLSLLVWFIFGAVMLVPGLEDVGWRDAVFALLALTVLRMVPVAIALAGSGLDRATVAFVGWFGPRGLASVVFGLIAVDSLAPSESKVVLAAVTLTVALSVLLHGVSASPLAARYGAFAARLGPEGPEHTGAAPISIRTLRPASSTLGRRDPAP